MISISGSYNGAKIASAMKMERLIDSVRSKPVLYDIRDKKYKDSIAKENSWALVAQESGIEVTGKNFLTISMFITCLHGDYQSISQCCNNFVIGCS